MFRAFRTRIFLRLDLAGHDSKEISVRRGLIEGAISTNANNSMTKSQILKSPFLGGQSSSQSEIMVAVKFLVSSLFVVKSASVLHN